MSYHLKRLFRLCPARNSYLILLLLLLSLLVFKTNEIWKPRKRNVNDAILHKHDYIPRDTSKHTRFLKDSMFRLMGFAKGKENTSYPDDYNGPFLYTEYQLKRYGNKHLSHIRPILPALGAVVNDISAFQFSLNPAASMSNDLTRYYCSGNLFTIIISAAENFINRNMIRHTWVKDLSKFMSENMSSSNPRKQQASYAFLVAFPNNRTHQSLIEAESNFYGDIIQVNIVDTYRNLTAKSAAMVYWALNYCNSTKFILKVDDDIYVNTNNLLNITKELLTSSSYYAMPMIIGTLIESNAPVRDPSSKYYNSNETWPWSSYPNHLFGGVYLISQSALLPLMAAIQTTPYTMFEDVYITALCARKARIEILSNERLLITKGRMPEIINHCFVANGIAAWETITISELLISHWMVHDLISTKEISLGKGVFEFCSLDDKVNDLFFI